MASMITRKSLKDLLSRRNLLYGSIMLSLGVTIACLAGVVSFIIFEQVTSSSLSVDINNPEFVEGQATPDTIDQSLFETSEPPLPIIEPTLTPWDGAGRVSLLLLGVDYRDWSTSRDYSRSDTMILLTLDPLTHTAGILSIPRDIWVSIPGFQHGKINTAYYLGDAHKLPGGGPGLAVKTVEQFLGVPINFYAQVDFGVFVRFIDEIGGVKVDVPEEITIDLLGSGSATKKTLQPGVQVLPGEWALAYARARHTEGGDFDRAQRQQQVIMAIRDRIISVDMLTILISKADILYQELSSGVRTNLGADQIVKLAILASQVPDENIKRGVINEKFILFGKSPGGLSILIPIIDKIHVLRDDIFASSGALNPLTPGGELERMIAEGARVSIQNGSNTVGLAENTEQYLQSLGMNVISISDYPQNVTLTNLIDHSGKPHTSSYLVDLMGISGLKILYDYNPDSNVDIELILGNDWARNNPLP
jgi:LCP family protein required for cell wall assembly